MSACPIDTSSRLEILSLRYFRFLRSRSCPALSPNPREAAFWAATIYSEIAFTLSVESRTDADTQLAAHIKDLPTRQFLLKNLGRDENGQFKWKINLSVITKQIEFVGAGINDSEVINTPTLFVRGGKSDYIKLTDEPIIKKIFPNSTLKTIEGASHWIHAEKPVEFINLIFEFDSE